MNTIVWVYGSSAAGKQTFIERFLENPISHITKAIRIENFTFLSSKESIKYIQQFEGDPISEKRIEIIDYSLATLNNNTNTCIFIKGQDVDLEKKIPNLLFEKTPETRHILFFLDLPLNIIHERVRLNTWWDDEDEMGGEVLLGEWLENQKRMLRELKCFEILAIDSSDFEYRIIKDFVL